MNDQQFILLRYRLETENHTRFDSPPPIERETEDWKLLLDKGDLTVELKRHFDSVSEARQFVDEYLRAWEIDAAFQYGQPEIKFIFQNANIIDRNPLPPGTGRIVQLLGSATLNASGLVATLSVSRKTYPVPPEYFRLSPDVDTLWHRFEQYRTGHEPLPAMAYFCLTMLEVKAPAKKIVRKNPKKPRQTPAARKWIAVNYDIDEEILMRLGELTSTRGSRTTARKVVSNIALKELSGAEQVWLEAAIKALIRKVGEKELAPSIHRLTMSDLPPL